MNRRCAMTLVMAVATQVVVAAQTTDSLVGKWAFDVSASTSTGGKPSASTLTISEVAPQTLKFEIRDTFDGRVQEPWGFLAGPEGTEQAVSPASFIDTVATTRRRGRSSSLVLKKGGTVVSEMTTEVSEDGLTLTVTSKASAPNGDSVTGTSIYRRLPS